MNTTKRSYQQGPEASNPARHEVDLEHEYNKYFNHQESAPFSGYDILNPYDYSKPVEAVRGTGA